MTTGKVALASGILLQKEVDRFLDDLKELEVLKSICVRQYHETSEGVQVELFSNGLLPPEVTRNLLQESLQRGMLHQWGWGRVILMVSDDN